MSNVELTMTLRDQQLVAGLLAALRHQDRVTDAVGRTTKAAKGWEDQLKKTQRAFDSDAWNRQLDKTKRGIEEAAKAATALRDAFVAGKGGLSASAEIDRWARGMNKIGTEASKAKLEIQALAQAARNAFMAGQGGLGAATPIDRWFDGLQRMKQQGMDDLLAKYSRGGNRGRFDAAQAAAASQIASAQSERVNAAMRPYDGPGAGNAERGIALEQARAAAMKESVVQAQRLADEAKRLTTTPIDRYNARMRELGVALKDRAIDQKGFNALTGQAKRELDAAGAAGKQAFGSTALRHVADYALGLVSVAATVGLIKRGFDEITQARNKAMASMEGQQDKNRDLSQLATPEFGMTKLLSERDRLAQKFGLGQNAAAARQEASDVLFAARSADLSAAETEYAGRAGIIGDASDTAQLLGSIKNFRKGEIAPEAAANVMLKASADSPKLNFNDFVKHYPSADITAKALGLSVEDATAIITMMSKNLGSPEEAFDRFTMLGGRMSLDDRMKGKGLEGFQTLADMSEADRLDFLGERKEAWQGFRAYEPEMGNIRGYSKELSTIAAQTGTGKDALDQQIRERMSDPGERAQFKLRRSRVKEEIAREKALGVGATTTEQIFADQRAADEAAGISVGGRLGRSGGQAAAWGAGFGGETAATISEGAARAGASGMWPFPGYSKPAPPSQQVRDPQMDEQTRILQEISGKLDGRPAAPARVPSPRPGGGRR